MSKDRRDSKKTKTQDNKSNVLCNECNEPCSQEDKLTISCDICKQWYHKGCTNIKTSEWKFMITNPLIFFTVVTYALKKKEMMPQISER